MARHERPDVVVFDVNETLSDLVPLQEAFRRVGLPPTASATWFASVLRDGFALTVTGGSAAFADIGRELLLGMLPEEPAAPDGAPLSRTEAADQVLATVQELPVHPDVVPGIRALRRQEIRLVTLSNGSVGVAEGLLSRAGVRDCFEALLSVEEVGLWKPAAAAYRYALDRTGVDAGKAMLVATHPWDIHGASRAGLRTAWVSREAKPFPAYADGPDLAVTSLEELVQRLDG